MKKLLSILCLLALAGCTFPGNGVTPLAATTSPKPPTPLPATATPAFTPSPPPEAIDPGNAGRLTELRRYGKGAANDWALSPDGTLLAVGCPFGVDLYALPSLQAVRSLASTSVFDIAFSPDGATLAAGLFDTVVVWRISDGTLVHTLGTAHHMQAVAFSPDGRLLASGTNSGSVILWDLADGSRVRTLEHEAGVSGVAFSADGKMVAGVSNALRGNSAWVWMVADGELVRILKGPVVTSFQRRRGGSEAFFPKVGVAFSPDGAFLAVGSYVNNSVLVWRLSDGNLVQTLDGMDAVFSPDGATLATTDAGRTSLPGDETIELYRVSDWSLVRTVPGYGLGFSPDWEMLAYLNLGPVFGDAIDLLDLSSGKTAGTLKGHFGSVTAIAFSPDGATLVSGHRDGKLRFWSTLDGSLQGTVQWHAAAVVSIAFSPDGGWLATGTEDDTVSLWNIAEGVSYPLDGKNRIAAFSPDGTLLATGSAEGSVSLWQVSDRSLVRTMEVENTYDAGVTMVTFSPDGELVALASRLREAMVWRVADGSRLFSTWGSEVAFAPDGTLWVAGGYSEAKLYKIADGSLVRTLTLAAYMEDLVFAPNGELLVMAGANKVYLQQMSDGALLKQFTGINANRYMLALSPDGALLAAGSVDGTVTLWGLGE